MSGNIPVETEDGQVFFVEVEQSGQPARSTPAGRGAPDDPVAELGPGLESVPMGATDRVLNTEIFQRAVRVIKEVSQDVTSGLLLADPAPSEVQLSLDLGFDAGGNVWIVKGGARATMRLLLKWRMPEAK